MEGKWPADSVCPRLKAGAPVFWLLDDAGEAGAGWRSAGEATARPARRPKGQRHAISSGCHCCLKHVCIRTAFIFSVIDLFTKNENKGDKTAKPIASEIDKKVVNKSISKIFNLPLYLIIILNVSIIVNQN